MNLDDTPTPPVLSGAGDLTADTPISQLVAEVYESASPALRSRVLEQLLRPLGLLSLVAVANGTFADICIHSGWPDIHIPIKDAQKVQASDVAALVERVQQVSGDSINGLARMLSASPMMTCSAATVLLVTILMQRARTRREGDGDPRAGRRKGHDLNATAP
jgi:hypothetical protein